MRANHEPMNITAGYVLTWGLIGLCVLAIVGLAWSVVYPLIVMMMAI